MQKHHSYLLSEVQFNPRGIEKLLKQLPSGKSAGPDGIPGIILAKCSPELAAILSKIFLKSLDTGEVPKIWNFQNVLSIHKK